MNKRPLLALSLYIALWAVIAAGMIYGVVSSGYPLWAAALAVYALFMILNGSLAYKVRAQQDRLEGKEPPPYLLYLLRANGAFEFTKQAPKSTHVLVGIAATLIGIFFLFCGVALALHAEWSRIDHPIFAATICLVLAGMGAAFVYAAWRLFAVGSPPNAT